MKKILNVLFASVLSVALVACSTPATQDAPATSTAENVVVPGSVLVVDSGLFKGNFYNGFGNTSEDRSVKDLLYRVGTVYTTKLGELKINPTVVKETKEEVDAEGNKTYIITLQNNLKWSDGQPLTAKDYVFSALFDYSDEYAAVGANITSDGSLIGIDEYKAGIKFENYTAYLEEVKAPKKALAEAEEGSDAYKKATEELNAVKAKYGEAEGENGVFKGVKLIDDYTFSMTIKKEFLPYFYETLNLGAGALPLHLLAPNAEIKSSDAGVELVGVNLDDVAKAFVEKDGYLFKPSVVSGPYTLHSFENNEVILKVNPNYAGSPTGLKPSIETIIIKGSSNPGLAGERLLNGEVDIVAGQFQAEIVSKLEENKIPSTKYNRLGYGYMTMGFDAGPTSDVHVRKALAHMLDRQALISSFLGAGNGIIVNSEYTTAHWMYEENKEALSELNSYDYSIDEAIKELDQSSYRFQQDGKTPWVAGSGYRYNDKGEMLLIKHFGTENNPITDHIKSDLTQNSEKVGMKYEVTVGDWNALIDQYYFWNQKPVEERYNVFNLATSFTAVYDPYYNNHSRNNGTDSNPMNINDAQLDKLIEEMRKLSPDQRDEYSKLWLEYQKRYNEILPLVPLYANVYRDYYNGQKIESLPTTAFSAWYTVIEEIKLK